MSEAQVLQAIGSWCILICAVLGVVSVVLLLRVRWWSTEMGRHLMAYISVTTLILLLGAVRFIFGDAPWFALLRAVVFAALPIVLAQRLWLQLKAQSRGRNSEPAADTQPTTPATPIDVASVDPGTL